MHSANHPANHLGAWWADVKVALALLTRLPMGPRGDAEAPDIARAGRAMPLAGALIGLVGAAAFWLSGGLGLPPLVSGLVAVAAAGLCAGNPSHQAADQKAAEKSRQHHRKHRQRLGYHIQRPQVQDYVGAVVDGKNNDRRRQRHHDDPEKHLRHRRPFLKFAFVQ